MQCECCNNKHDGLYGSGRFCSKKCARSFSTKEKRKTINVKVSEKLTGRKLSDECVEKIRTSWATRKGLWTIGDPPLGGRPLTDIKNLLVENSSYTSKYIKERLIKDNIKEYICEECGVSSYNSKPLTLQLHHKNGIRNDHRIENLEILCPNCHSQTHNYAGKNRTTKKRFLSSTGLEHPASNGKVVGPSPTGITI